jgi:uncharacterized Zn finger protein
MPRENAEQKARRYLGEGRLQLIGVSNDRVLAQVRGDGRTYLVRFEEGVWSCPCPARSDQCAHLRAVRLVVAVGAER